MTPLNIVGYLFAAAVTYSCVQYLRDGGLKEDLQVFKGRSPKEWAEIVVGDLAAVGALIGLYTLSFAAPKMAQGVLQFSWMQLLATKGENAQGSNQMLSGAMIPYFGPIFLLLLFVNLPRLAAAEEEEFRLGTKNWKHAVPRSISFGLMHMIVGLPLSVALALSIPGMWFTSQYFKGGVARSTAAHAVYNMMLATVLFVYVVQSQFAPHPAKSDPKKPANVKIKSDANIRVPGGKG
jgi:hypothetical protein